MAAKPTPRSWIWRPNRALPILADHSRMKLELFGRYLYDYLTIVGAKQRRFGHLELTVIDAFSGGGKFRSLERTEDDVKGSPLVLIDAAERARAALHEGAQGPQLDWNVRFVFNDVAPEHTAYLKTALKDEGIDPSDDEFTILTGTFESNLERMIAEVQKVSPRSGRSIWLLDQTGWNGATLQSIARILAKLPRSEIILTLALDNLLRLAINNPSSQATLERVGFSKSVLDEIRQGGDPKHAGAIGQRALMDEILHGPDRRITAASSCTRTSQAGPSHSSTSSTTTGHGTRWSTFNGPSRALYTTSVANRRISCPTMAWPQASRRTHWTYASRRASASGYDPN